MSTAPPPGVYVPAVLFFTQDEELDEPAIAAHVLRLAQVPLPSAHQSTT
jgi:4-hydroxy-2-oxoglutarate aldolase